MDVNRPPTPFPVPPAGAVRLFVSVMTSLGNVCHGTIGDLPVLTKEEIRKKLARMTDEGDEDAAVALIEHELKVCAEEWMSKAIDALHQFIRDQSKELGLPVHDVEPPDRGGGSPTCSECKGTGMVPSPPPLKSMEACSACAPPRKTLGHRG